MCERILDANPNAELWPVIKAQLLKQAEGKIVLRPSVAEDIERAAGSSSCTRRQRGP